MGPVAREARRRRPGPHRRVDVRDLGAALRIEGAVAAYLLVAYGWALACQLVDLSDPVCVHLSRHGSAANSTLPTLLVQPDDLDERRTHRSQAL